MCRQHVGKRCRRTHTDGGDRGGLSVPDVGASDTNPVLPQARAPGGGQGRHLRAEPKSLHAWVISHADELALEVVVGGIRIGKQLVGGPPVRRGIPHDGTGHVSPAHFTCLALRVAGVDSELDLA